MDIRRLPTSQGMVWFRQAIDLGAKNPRAVFGASLLVIGALYATAILMAVVISALAVGGKAAGKAPDLGMALAIALPMTLLLMLLVPVLLGGLMHVVREAESGRSVRALDVFTTLQHADGRRLAWLGLVQVGLAVAGGLLTVAITGSDYWRDYLSVMQAAMQGAVQAMPEPKHPGLLFVVQMLFNYFSYSMMLFAIPLMLFSRSGLVDALRDALRASVRNPGANLLAGVLFIAALIVAAIVVALITMLVTLLGSMIHPTLGAILAMLVMVAFAAVVLVLIVGATYLAWRDTFGDAQPPEVQPVHGFEA